MFGVTLGGVLGHFMCTGVSACACCLPAQADGHRAWGRGGSGVPGAARPVVMNRCRCPSLLGAGAAVLGGKHLAEHIDERKVAYL